MEHISTKIMQQLDKYAIETLGIPGIVLMENAGFGAVEVALGILGKNTKVICICGKGNNGGDGFVCARHLIESNIDVEIFIIGNTANLKGNAKANYEILKKISKKIKILNNKEDFKIALSKTDLLIDAIFGIGLSGEVKQPYKDVIDIMNESKKPVLAIDIPSGLDATTGEMLGICIKATKTATFAYPKTGFIKNKGPECTGKVIVVDISIPESALRAIHIDK